MSQISEAAVRVGGLPQITQYVTSDDANRLRDIGEKNSILDQQLQTFQRNWKEKYKQDFTLKDQQLALNDRSIQITPGITASGQAAQPIEGQGTASTTPPANPNEPVVAPSPNAPLNPEQDNRQKNATAAGAANPNPTAVNSPNPNPNATAAGETSPNATAANSTVQNPNPTAGVNNNAVNVPPPPAAPAPGEAIPAAGRVNPTPPSSDPKVATLTIPASHNLPAASVVLTREPVTAQAGAAPTEMWKVNLPDSVDTRQFQQSLARHLRELNNNQASWPANANEAQNMVAHTVALALSEPGLAPKAVNNNKVPTTQPAPKQ
jgi:hypothetical protein